MRRSCLVLLLLCVLAGGSQKKVNTDFLSLISTGSSIRSAEDAIQAVLQLLGDLKGANEETQKKADQFFGEFEGIILQDISDLTKIMTQNQESFDKNSEDLEAVQDKIAQTKDYLDWNEKRRNSNNNKLETLAEQGSQRCEANSLFIDTLRQYKEALSVLEWVRGDLSSKDNHSFIQEQESNEYAQKLSFYANMFKETELNEFLKLGEDDTVSLLQNDDNGDQQKTNEQLANQVVSDVVAKVQKLIEKIRDAIKNLEEQEITSANDFVDFRNNILSEQAQLMQEYDSRYKFLHSLLDDLEFAQDVVAQCGEILKNTKNILIQTQDSYKQYQQSQAIEKQKRHQENQMIEEIILIYKNKIADAKLFLQEKVGDIDKFSQ